MSDQRQEASLLSLPMLLLATSMVGGYFAMQSPLETVRPETPEGEPRPPLTGEAVESRLWQDPLELAYQHQRGHRKHVPHHHQVRALQDQIRERLDGGVLILPVMVTRQRYSENIESRKRTRYAVLSALAVAGYAPEDPGHVGYFVLTSEDGDGSSPSVTGSGSITGSDPRHPPQSGFHLEWNVRLDASSGEKGNDHEQHEHGADIDGLFAYEWFERDCPDPAQASGEGAGGEDERCSGCHGHKAENSGAIDRCSHCHSCTQDGPWCGILVVWVPDEWLLQRQYRRDAEPLAKLRTLLCRLRCFPAERDTDSCSLCTSGICTKTCRPSVRLIGPRTSTTLRAMIKENPAASAVACGASPPCEEEIHLLYSPWSSVALDSMLPNENNHETKPCRCECRSQSNCKEGDPVAKSLCAANFTFRRTIHTDANLGDALVSELELRGVNPARDHIALISEWDTHYGRRLPESFQEAYGDTKNEEKRRVHRFSYLRGIDGLVPRSHNTPNGNHSNSGRDEKRRAIGAVGPGQIDYLQRLVRQIKSLDGNEARCGNGRGIRAIGVLGSDVYDKLLILCALRREFPRAYFFTTDLDARLADEGELHWSRNLIVASSFGLELHREHQGFIPAFRNSYQTSVFFACLAALNHPGDRAASDRMLDRHLSLPARIFEIGRDGPYDLTPQVQSATCQRDEPRAAGFWSRWGMRPARSDDQSDGEEDSSDAVSRIHPQRFRPSSRWEVFEYAGVLGILFIFMLGLAAPFCPRVREQWYPTMCRGPACHGSPTKRVLVLFPAIALVLVVVVVYCILNRYPIRLALLGGLVASTVAVRRPLSERSRNWLAWLAEPSTRVMGWFDAVKAALTRVTAWHVAAAVVLLFVVIVPLMAVLAFGNGAGEPFLFSGGISLWPTILLRTLAGCLGMFFIWRCYQALRESDETISKNLLNVPREPCPPPFPGLPGNLQELQDALAKISISGWDPGKWGTIQVAAVGRERFVRIWNEYRTRCHWLSRLCRCLPMTIAYVIAAWFIYVIAHRLLSTSGFLVPYRGGVARWVHHATQLFFLLAAAALVFVIVDANWLCRRLIAHLSQAAEVRERVWLPGIRGTYTRPAEFAPRDEWLAIQLIAQRSEVVGNAVLYPFIILFVGILSQLRYFYKWDPPVSPPLTGVVLGILACAVIAAVQMQLAAWTARRKILHRLENQLIEARAIAASQASAGADVRPATARVEQIQQTVADIRRERRGAFGPLLQNPALGAALIPIGGWGGLIVLQEAIQTLAR